MTTPDAHDDSLKAELNALGENLQRAIRTVWESDDRKRLQADVESGLEAALQHLRGEVQEFKDSDTGKRLKTDLQSLESDLRSDETAARMRQEILRVLHGLNEDLERAARPPAGGSGDPGDPSPGPGAGG